VSVCVGEVGDSGRLSRCVSLSRRPLLTKPTRHIPLPFFVLSRQPTCTTCGPWACTRPHWPSGRRRWAGVAWWRCCLESEGGGAVCVVLYDASHFLFSPGQVAEHDNNKPRSPSHPRHRSRSVSVTPEKKPGKQKKHHHTTTALNRAADGALSRPLVALSLPPPLSPPLSLSPQPRQTEKDWQGARVSLSLVFRLFWAQGMGWCLAPAPLSNPPAAKKTRPTTSLTLSPFHAHTPSSLPPPPHPSFRGEGMREEPQQIR
jgi:hypothetical protein